MLTDTALRNLKGKDKAYKVADRDDENDILRALRHGAAGSFNQVGQQAVGRSLDIPPTLTIRPGAPVRVMVTRDLILEPYRG